MTARTHLAVLYRAYIDRILTRLTTGGAIYLAVVCIVPTVLITEYNIPFYFGGTGLLIVVFGE